MQASSVMTWPYARMSHCDIWMKRMRMNSNISTTSLSTTLQCFSQCHDFSFFINYLVTRLLETSYIVALHLLAYTHAHIHTQHTCTCYHSHTHSQVTHTDARDEGNGNEIKSRMSVWIMYLVSRLLVAKVMENLFRVGRNVNRSCENHRGTGRSSRIIFGFLGHKPNVLRSRNGNLHPWIFLRSTHIAIETSCHSLSQLQHTKPSSL